jgi:hypothetical protein
LSPVSSHSFRAFLFDSTCAIKDGPSLHPVPLPEGHDTNNNAIANNNAVPFLVWQYFIEGVHHLPQELHSHVIVFYEELITLMEGASESWQLITKEKYTTILTVLISIHDGEPVKLLRSIYPQIYKWYKKYALITSGDRFVIMACPHNSYDYAGVDKNVDVETVRRLTYFEAAYSEICRAHGPELAKGHTLSAHLNKHVENIRRQPCKLFTNTCPICCDNRTAQHWVVRFAGWISCRGDN